MIERTLSGPARGAAMLAQIAAQIVSQVTRPSAAIARRIIRGALANTHRIIHEAAVELARINRAGLSAEALAGKSRRTRARLVTAALARRHNGHNQCC